jgi:hypothetical protein
MRLAPAKLRAQHRTRRPLPSPGGVFRWRSVQRDPEPQGFLAAKRGVGLELFDEHTAVGFDDPREARLSGVVVISM